MRTELPIEDDPVIRRVAAVRPPVPEEDLRPDSPSASAIAERVLARAAASPSGSPRRGARRPRPALTWVGLAVAPAAAAVVLLFAGTFRGPDSSGTQPAAASVIRATVDALAPEGAILIQDETFVSGPSVHGHPHTLDQVLRTPAGRGAQSLLTTYSDPRAVGSRFGISAWAYVGGEQAFYSRTTNTIYETSIWGPYLHPGPRRGTFVYRDGPGAPATVHRPVTVTAVQRRALLRGEDSIRTTSRTVGSKVQIGAPKVQTALRAPGYAETVREQISHHVLQFAGRTTIDGRAAFELSTTKSRLDPTVEHVYLDPVTHLPFEEIDGPGTPHRQVIHLRLRKLPITRANDRLLSLRALHPTARIDRNHADYLRAAHGTQFYIQ